MKKDGTITIKGKDITIEGSGKVNAKAGGDIVIVDDPFVEAAHRHGVAVHVWTVNDTESMERLVELGVDGIISDVPTELMGVLYRHRVAWRGGEAAP